MVRGKGTENTGGQGYGTRNIDPHVVLLANSVLEEKEAAEKTGLICSCLNTPPSRPRQLRVRTPHQRQGMEKEMKCY